MNTTFALGTTTVPCARRGDWAVETFVISDAEASLHNIRCSMRPGGRLHQVRPGEYKRLIHARRGVVMSNTPMEVMTNQEDFRQAKGSVLINGLGMGMLLEAILAKPEVTSVRVVEVDADVLAMVGPHFATDPRVTLVHADAFTYQPAKGETFDFVWHDIWDDISVENLDQMKALVRKYRRPRAAAQGVWSRAWLDL